jgi:hypothetical protein
MDAILLERLIERAQRDFDGHLTILRFTTNWRVGFITPSERSDVDSFPVGDTFEEAAKAALAISTKEHWERCAAAEQAFDAWFRSI